MNLIHLFTQLKLRIKLLIAFGSLLLLTVILMLIFFDTLKEIDRYEFASKTADGVNINMLEMEVAVNYFIMEGFKETRFQKDHTSTYLDTYEESKREILIQLDSLQLQNGADSLLIRPIQDTLMVLNHKVSDLVNVLTKRGFKDYGLEGQLRQAIHAVEKSDFPYNKADMLTLRRHEKDFFLRKDLKYQAEFNLKVKAFTEEIAQSKLNEKTAMLGYVDEYHRLFNEIILFDTEIGLKENEGMKGIIHRELESISKNVQKLRAEIKVANERFRNHTIRLFVFAFGVELLLGLTLAITYANIITRSIKELKRAMDQLAVGQFPGRLPVRSKEELGLTKEAFNLHLDRIIAASRFAEAMGNGNRQVTYPVEYSGDVLAAALIKMQGQLLDAHVSETRSNWTNSGIAQLNEILKNESENLHALADRILKFVVSYLKMNQGALYLLVKENGESYLSRISTYAYDKKKFISDRIEVGQGLVGQCVLEKTPVVLTQVPADYVKITSGMGEALPRFVILSPLLFKGEVSGVLELASFDILNDHEIEFLHRISEHIGIMLQGRTSSADMEKMVESMKQKAEELQKKEEEVRQYAEEMQVTIEQMEMEKRMLEDRLQNTSYGLEMHSL